MRSKNYLESIRKAGFDNVRALEEAVYGRETELMAEKLPVS
jgi:hypothetical protein